jgi:hypothetical protein
MSQWSAQRPWKLWVRGVEASGLYLNSAWNMCNMCNLECRELHVRSVQTHPFVQVSSSRLF